MPFKQILQKVASGSGLSNLVTNTEQKIVLVALINIAAEEIYEKIDLPECLREICVQVQPNSQLALPPYVGEIRSIRDKCLKQPWSILDLRPRYTEFTWKETWKNFRHKGYSPIQTSIVNAAPLTFTIATPDDTVITVTGSTVNARKVTDSVVMSATSVAGNKNFLTIESIIKSKRNDSDIYVYDASSNLLAVVFNDFIESRYILLDVSAYPSAYCGTFSVMEVLYKLPLRYMELDTDTFPADNYDSIIASKALQLLMETEEGKELRATYFEARTDKLLSDKVADKLEGQSKPMDIRSLSSYAIMDQLARMPYQRGYRRLGGPVIGGWT